MRLELSIARTLPNFFLFRTPLARMICAALQSIQQICDLNYIFDGMPMHDLSQSAMETFFNLFAMNSLQ